MRPESRRVDLLLFSTALLVYLFSGPTFFGWDGEIMYRVSESLVLRHSLHIVDPIYHFAQPYSPYGIGTSLVLLPFVALGQLLLHDPRGLTLLYLPLVTAFSVVTLNRLLLSLAVPPLRALALSLTYAFGTLAWHYAGVLFSEPLVALCVLQAVLSMRVFSRTGRTRWLWGAGGWSGLCLLTRIDSLVLVLVPLTAYLLWRVRLLEGRRPARLLALLAYAGPIAAALVVSIAYDVIRYGRPFSGPYTTDPIGFATPLLTGLYGLLLSPGAGLLVFTPVLLVAAFSFRRFLRAYPAEAMLIAALLLLRLAFFSRWWDWAGGATWGPRYLVPLVPLLLLPLAWTPPRLEKLAGGLALVGVGIQVVGQLVPYGLYYGMVVPHVASMLGICHCVPSPSRGSMAVLNFINFNWPYSALPVQLNLLVQGVWAPTWRPIAYLVPVVMGSVVVLIGDLRRTVIGSADQAAVEVARSPRTSSATTS